MGLLVDNLDIMVTFYRDVLNLKQNISMDGFAGFETENGFFFNLCSKNFLHNLSGLSIPYPKGLNGRIQISFNVPTYADVDIEYTRLINAGAQPISNPTSKPYGLREAFIADPEGNLIELVASES